MTISCTNRSLAGGRWLIQYRHGDGGRWAVRPPADAGLDRRAAGIRNAHDAQALVADLPSPADRARSRAARGAAAAGGPVRAWLTTGDGAHLLAEQPPDAVGAPAPTAPMIAVDPTRVMEAIVKLSARNQLPARVVRITSGEAIANVELDVNGMRVVASITVEAVRELGLQEGAEVTAIVKASDVMVAVAD